MHRIAAFVSTVEAIKAIQLPAAMSYYGPLAAGAWALIQVIKAIRRRMASLHPRDQTKKSSIWSPFTREGI